MYVEKGFFGLFMLSQAKSRLLARKIWYKYVLIFEVYVHAASNFLYDVLKRCIKARDCKGCLYILSLIIRRNVQLFTPTKTNFDLFLVLVFIRY